MNYDIHLLQTNDMETVTQEIDQGLHVLSKMKTLMIHVHKIVNISPVGIIIEADPGLHIVRIRNINLIEILDQDPEIDIVIAVMSLNVMISNVIPNMMKDKKNIISTMIKEVVVITKSIKVKRKVKNIIVDQDPDDIVFFKSICQ